MWRIAIVLVCFGQICSAQARPGPQVPPPAPASSENQPPAAKSSGSIVVPAGTTVELAISQPVLARTAKPGDEIYAITIFPVAIDNRMAIPPGTYAAGQIDALTLPRAFSPYAQFQIHFTKLIFANGYVVDFAGPQNIVKTPSGTGITSPVDVISAVAVPYVQVTPANDVLLDNGAQIEMTLQLPLLLDRASINAALRQTVSAQLNQFKSASLCRSYPGTTGTPDTVIPGSPGTPGTPDIVIPGAAGSPPVVIPGTPGTPGTSPTVIPGSAGSPGYYCPPPPVVMRPKLQNYMESFSIAAPLEIAGSQLSSGRYQVSWTGPNPKVEVEIKNNATTVATVRARVVILNSKSPADTTATRTNSDGSVSLDSIRFAGQSFALYFK